MSVGFFKPVGPLPIGITWFPPPVFSSGLLPLRNLLFDDLSEPDLLDLKDTCELTAEAQKIPSLVDVFMKLLGILLATLNSMFADDFFLPYFFFFSLLLGLAWKELPELLFLFLLALKLPWLS